MSEISLAQFAATPAGAATIIDVRQPREYEALSVVGGVTAWATSGRPLVSGVRPTAAAS